MKASEIKAGHFYTDGKTVRVVTGVALISLHCYDLTLNEMIGCQRTQHFASWATCEVKPIWALMEPCDRCESDDVAFSYQGRSYCLACGRKQPEGTGRVAKNG